jgi:hypothetical protein
MSDYRRGALVYSKDRLLVPADAGEGRPPDDRPNGIPADLGSVAEQKSTLDITSGYAATWRGRQLERQPGKRSI